MALPDISLAEFNRIASGEYNAGQIDFETDRNGGVSLVKVDGKPQVDWVPKTNRWTGAELKATLMGATTLDGPWTAVPASGNPALRFFKAVLPLP